MKCEMSKSGFNRMELVCLAATNMPTDMSVSPKKLDKLLFLAYTEFHKAVVAALRYAVNN